MKTTIISEIIAFLFGRKYYANTICTRGTTKCEICCFIFADKERACLHRLELQATLSFEYIETITFRSRHDYRPREASGPHIIDGKNYRPRP